MKPNYTEKKVLEKVDFTKTPLQKGEYDYCLFKGDDFSNVDLADHFFIECVFENCNLSMATLSRTTFLETTFRNCKMLGLHFEDCNNVGFSVNFEDCNLNHSSFYQTKLKKAIFKNLRLLEVDFTECDLSSSIFTNCDFSGAIFQNTILENVDLHTSFNYSIDPERNRIKKAKFSMPGLTGLLDKYDIVIL